MKRKSTYKCPICGAHLETWEKKSFDPDGYPEYWVFYRCPNCNIEVGSEIAWLDREAIENELSEKNIRRRLLEKWKAKECDEA